MQETKLLLTRQTLLQQGGLVDDLRTVADEWKERLTSLGTELCLHTKSHEQQLDKVQQKLDAATAQLNDATAQLRRTTQRLSDKSTQFDNLQQQLTETSAQLEQANRQAQFQQKQIEKQVTVHATLHATLHTALFTQHVSCIQVQKEVDRRLLADLQQKMADLQQKRADSPAGSRGASTGPADTSAPPAPPQPTHKTCSLRLEIPPSDGARAGGAAAMAPLSPPAAALSEEARVSPAALASTGTASHCQPLHYILAYTP